MTNAHETMSSEKKTNPISLSTRKQVRISSDLFILLRRPDVSSPQTQKIRST